MSLRLRPVTIKRALPFVREVHRKLPRVQGAMWGISVRNGDNEIVGVALVGNAARMFGPWVLSVLRVAVYEGVPNACSMLYGACSRAARAGGADGLVTYTTIDEPGTSLRASGWVSDGFTKGGEHSRKSRPRAPAVDPRPKQRWWAPWSKRVLAARPTGDTE